MYSKEIFALVMKLKSELFVSYSIFSSSVLMKCDSSNMIFLYCPVSYFSHGDTGYYKAIRQLCLLHDLKGRGSLRGHQ